MTPPRVSLSNMSSGNFDFPPASSSINGQGSSSHLARLVHIRQAIQREAEHQENEQQIAQDLEDITSASRNHQRPAASSAPSMPRRNRRATRGSSRSFSHTDDSNRAQLVAPPQDTLRISAIRNRPHAEPSQRFNNLRRVRQQRDQLTRNSGLADLEQAGDRLTEISQGLSTLIGNSSQTLRVELEDGDDGTGQRRFKRRKLDRDDSSLLPNIRYGHSGQVVPGKLKMEIVSCDGGELTDSSGDSHNVENVLKNDMSVYCTKKSTCNLLLRHQGETNFSLDNLVIKAPDCGFTSPVQEGMVFVAMDSQQLMEGTAPYQIDYESSSPPSRSSSTSSSSSRRPERISFQESLHDPEVLTGTLNRRQNLYEYQIDELRRGHEARFARLLRTRRHIESVRNRENWSDNCDINESNAIVSPAAPSPPPQLQGLHVTQEADQESSSESDEEPPSSSIMADLLRRDNQWRASSDDDEDEEDARHMNFHWATRSRNPSSRSLRMRTRRRSSPSKVEAEEGVGEVLAPHARFFMQGPTSKVTIKFDPPVSGKFILLKLWSPVRHGNIDVKHIAVHGYAGPRYFPACEMR